MQFTLPADLSQSLAATNKHFLTLLTHVPASLYFSAVGNEDDGRDGSSKYQKNKRGDLTEVDARSAKRIKLDPKNALTIPEILAKQSASVPQPAPASSKAAKQKTKSKKASTQPIPDAIDIEASFDAESSASSSSSHDPSPDEVESSKSQSQPQEIATIPMQPDASISSLRAKLHAKIESLKPASRRLPVSFPEDGADGAMNRDELLQQRRAKLEETRLKKRAQRKEAKKAADAAAKGKVKTSNSSISSHKFGKHPDSKEADAENDSTNVDIKFSSIDLPSEMPKKKQHGAANNDPKAQLAYINAKKERIAAMPLEKRTIIAEKERWSAAEKKIDGEKVRDDEAKLKKSIRRKDHVKAKSSKEWADRKENTKSTIEKKIKKRNENIAARQQQRKDKVQGVKNKNKKPANKPSKKARAGFEGKPSGGKKSSAGGKHK